MPTLEFQRPFTKTEDRNWNRLPILALSGMNDRCEKTCWIMLSIYLYCCKSLGGAFVFRCDWAAMPEVIYYLVGPLSHLIITFGTGNLATSYVHDSRPFLLYMYLNMTMCTDIYFCSKMWRLSDCLQEVVACKKRTTGVSSEKLSWHVYFIKIIYCT